MQSSSITLSVLALAAATGCVSSATYDAAVLDAERTRSALGKQRTEAARKVSEKDAQIAALKRTMADAEAGCARTLQELQTTSDTALGCSRALDEATAVNQALKKELERLGKDADALLSAKGSLAASLEQARTRLEELRKAQAAAESRAQLFRELALKLKKMVDAGDLRILLRSGRMVLALPSDVLFDSGKAKIGTRGEETLGEVAVVLSSISGRRFQVAGHTDDEPIRVSGFASNWQLSAERGLAVVAYLIKQGMRPDALSAAGYGEFDPVAANDSAEHRSQNRRIEITVQPNIEELVAVPGVR
jgi:chemotaxis protein MotB